MSNNVKYPNTLITIIGPTAVGKTTLAIELAQQLNTEIISCDSRQFYKELKIGTAAPTDDELATVPHHFIHHKKVTENYTVGDYEKDATKQIKKLFKDNSTVILVGGSGLYEKAVTQGLDEFPDVSPKTRKKLLKNYKENGLGYLQDELKRVDPIYYQKVDIQNAQRLSRAIEIYRESGQPYSSFLNKKKPKKDFNILKIGLELSRQTLYDRINNRVDEMMKNGLLFEAQSVYAFKNCNALQTVGYKELFDFFEQKIELDTAVEEIKKNTRRFAKRQLTWYRKEEGINWFNPNYKKEIIDFVLQSI